MTLQEAYEGLAAKGLTLSGWAMSKGYYPQTARAAIEASQPKVATGKKPRLGGKRAESYQKILAELKVELVRPAEGPLPHSRTEVV